MNPAVVAADFLHHNLGKDKKVYLIGSQGVREELDHFGKSAVCSCMEVVLFRYNVLWSRAGGYG